MTGSQSQASVQNIKHALWGLNIPLTNFPVMKEASAAALDILSLNQFLLLAKFRLFNEQYSKFPGNLLAPNSNAKKLVWKSYLLKPKINSSYILVFTKCWLGMLSSYGTVNSIRMTGLEEMEYAKISRHRDVL